MNVKIKGGWVGKNKLKKCLTLKRVGAIMNIES